MQMRTAVATKPLANLPANIIISYDSATIIIRQCKKGIADVK